MMFPIRQFMIRRCRERCGRVFRGTDSYGKFLVNKGKPDNNWPLARWHGPKFSPNINLITSNADNWQAITAGQSDDVHPRQLRTLSPCVWWKKGRRSRSTSKWKKDRERERDERGEKPSNPFTNVTRGTKCLRCDTIVVVVLVDFIARSRPFGNREGVRAT